MTVDKVDFTPDGEGKGSAAVTITSFGEQRTFTFAMVKTPAGWRIDDISWAPDQQTLRQLLDDLQQAQRKSR